MSDYRKNASEMSIQEQLNAMNERIEKNRLNSDQRLIVTQTRNIAVSAIALIAISLGFGYSCNHEDNATKREVAKQCPAAAKDLATGNERQQK